MATEHCVPSGLSVRTERSSAGGSPSRRPHCPRCRLGSRRRASAALGRAWGGEAGRGEAASACPTTLPAHTSRSPEVPCCASFSCPVLLGRAPPPFRGPPSPTPIKGGAPSAWSFPSPGHRVHVCKKRESQRASERWHLCQSHQESSASSGVC